MSLDILNLVKKAIYGDKKIHGENGLNESFCAC